MSSHEFWIPIGISIAAFGLSFAAVWYSRRQVDSEAMLECFKILSNPDIKAYKAIIAQERRDNIAQGKPIIYDRTSAIRGYAETLISAYNQASVLYQLGLLNKVHFKKVYGGTLVRAWKLLEDDIDARSKSAGSDYASHFREVAKELIPEFQDREPY